MLPDERGQRPKILLAQLVFPVWPGPHALNHERVHVHQAVLQHLTHRAYFVSDEVGDARQRRERANGERQARGRVVRGPGLGDPAVAVDHLAVDPAGRAGEERDDLGDVPRLAEALERGGLGESGDRFVVHALQE